MALQSFIYLSASRLKLLVTWPTLQWPRSFNVSLVANKSWLQACLLPLCLMKSLQPFEPDGQCCQLIPAQLWPSRHLQGECSCRGEGEQGGAAEKGLCLLSEEMRVPGDIFKQYIIPVSNGYLSSSQSDPELLRAQTSFSVEYCNSIFPGEKKKGQLFTVTEVEPWNTFLKKQKLNFSCVLNRSLSNCKYHHHPSW